MIINSFWQKIVTVLIGSAGAQLILISIMPIITRVVPKDEVGHYLFAISIINIFLVLSTLRMEMAIFQETLENSEKIIRLIFIISFPISIIISLLGYYFANNDFILWFSVFISLVIIGVSEVIFSYWINIGDFRRVSIHRILQSIFISIFLITGIFKLNYENIIVYHVFGLFLWFLFLLSDYRIKLSKIKVSDFSFFLKHKNFILISTPSSLINSLSIQLPIILISLKYNEFKLAIFALMLKVMVTPVKLVGSSILTIFKQMASQEYRDTQKCVKSYKFIFYRLTFVSLIIFLPLIFFIEDLVVLIFGNDWKDAGKLAVYLVPMMLFKLIASPLTYIYFITNKQSIDFYWQVVLLVMTFLVFYSCNDFNTSILLYSLGYSILYLISLFITYSISKGKR